MAVKPICSNKRPSAVGSGAAYSTNSKPSVPSGLSQSERVAVAMMFLSFTEMVDHHFRHDAPLARVAGEGNRTNPSPSGRGVAVRAEPCQLSDISAKLSR